MKKSNEILLKKMSEYILRHYEMPIEYNSLKVELQKVFSVSLKHNDLINILENIFPQGYSLSVLTLNTLNIVGVVHNKFIIKNKTILYEIEECDYYKKTIFKSRRPINKNVENVLNRNDSI